MQWLRMRPLGGGKKPGEGGQMFSVDVCWFTHGGESYGHSAPKQEVMTCSPSASRAAAFTRCRLLCGLFSCVFFLFCFLWALFLHFTCCSIAGTNAWGGAPKAVNFHTFSREKEKDKLAYAHAVLSAGPAPPFRSRSLAVAGNTCRMRRRLQAAKGSLISKDPCDFEWGIKEKSLILASIAQFWTSRALMWSH